MWDNVIPESFPNILKFDTISSTWVEHKKTMGPYHIWEDKLYTQIDLVLSSKPFYDNGWDGETKLTQEDFNQVYNSDFFEEVRSRMRELAKYVGLKVSNFDAIINFSISIDTDSENN